MYKIHYWKKHLWALQVFLYVLISRPVRARPSTQLLWNIDPNNMISPQMWEVLITNCQLLLKYQGKTPKVQGDSIAILHHSNQGKAISHYSLIHTMIKI